MLQLQHKAIDAQLRSRASLTEDIFETEAECERMRIVQKIHKRGYWKNLFLAIKGKSHRGIL